MPNLSENEIKNLKRQGFTDDMISKMTPVDQPFVQNQQINNNISSIEKLLKKLEDYLKKANDFTERETNAIKGAGKILQGDFSILGKTIKNDFANSSKLFNNEIIKTGVNFANKFGGLLALVTTAIKEADKLIEKQGQMNKIGYMAAGNIDSFYNTKGLKAEFEIQAGMFNSERISDERIGAYLKEFSKAYSLYGPQKRDIGDISQLRSNLSTSLGVRGVDERIIENLTENLIIKQNKNFENFNEQFKQIQASQLYSGLSPNKFYDYLNKLMERGADFFLKLEDAAGYLEKFGKEVDKGTISLDNLLVYGSILTKQGVPQSAGLAAQLMQTGNLPPEAMKFAGDPLGLSGWLRANANSSSVQKGIENMVRTEAMTHGITSKEAMGEYFRLRYSQLGYNLNVEQYNKLAEGGSLTKKELETSSQSPEVQALNNLKTDAANIYANTTSFTKQFEDLAKFLKSAAILKMGQTAERFMKDTKEIVQDGKVLQTTGYFFKYFGEDLAEKWIKFADFLNNSDRYLEKDSKQLQIDVTGKVDSKIVVSDPQQ